VAKHIHAEAFTIDTEGKDRWRHAPSVFRRVAPRSNAYFYNRVEAFRCRSAGKKLNAVALFSSRRNSIAVSTLSRRILRIRLYQRLCENPTFRISSMVTLLRTLVSSFLLKQMLKFHQCFSSSFLTRSNKLLTVFSTAPLRTRWASPAITPPTLTSAL